MSEQERADAAMERLQGVSEEEGTAIAMGASSDALAAIYDRLAAAATELASAIRALAEAERVGSLDAEQVAWLDALWAR